MPRVVQGQIYKVSVDYKLISIKQKNKLEFFYLPPRFVREFRNFLYSGVFVRFICDTKRFRIKHHSASRIIAFEKIEGNRYHRKISYFDQNVAKLNILDRIDKYNYRMFMDLELTLQHAKDVREEIIQIGAILVNRNNEIIWTYNEFLKPTLIEQISKRTLKFLNISRDSIDNGISYRTFYEEIRVILLRYQPCIIIWGESDKNALINSYNINNVAPIFRDEDFINMQEVLKRYFNFNYELGLFTCAKLLNIECGTQKHDAYEDAYITKEIFTRFYKIAKGELEFDFIGALKNSGVTY